MLRAAALLAALFLTAARCDLPRDPRHTLDHVRAAKVLRVGVAEDRPFIVRNGEEATGIEAALITRFANEQGAHVEWIWEPQEKEFQALGKFELDLMAGGIDAKTPWKKQAAITRPVAEIHEDLASVTGTVPADLEKHEVTIEQGDAIGERLEKQKATVKRVAELKPGETLVAGTRARLRELGYSGGHPLETHKLVLAAPPGENAFLEQLEKYLAAHHSEFAHAAGETE
ncbi:MAG TPA: transporter substrate-binding domain-containing protein [Thermoanaerobaculia bacterium]